MSPMADEDEDAPSDAHLLLLALLLPYVSLMAARLNALWPSKGAIQLGQIASPTVITEAQSIILAGIGDAPSPVVAQAVEDVERVLKEQVTRARILLMDAQTPIQAEDAVRAIDYGVHRVERINDFVEVTHKVEQQEKTLKFDEILVWVPERDACIRCIRLAGLKGHKPPLHPNCRCELMKLKRDHSKSIIAGLKREAQRSIARGFSLPSESKSARLRATEALLRSGKANLPASVIKYAQQAIARGDYARGRSFPR